MKIKKGQISLEYLMIIGLLLVIIIPVLYYGQRGFYETTQVKNSQYSVDTLASAANSVCSFGPGAKKTIWLTFPDGIKNYTMSDQEINFQIEQYKGYSDVFAETDCEIEGTLPIKAGYHKIDIELTDDNIVFFGVQNCTDGFENQDETDIDCGGACGATCGENQNCRDDGDCSLGYCNTTASVCQEPPDAPIINLLSPLNGSVLTNSRMVVLEYNVYDKSDAIENCSLYLDDAINDTVYDPDESITINFSLTDMENATYERRVECFDNSTNHHWNTSETWEFLVNGTDEYLFFPDSIFAFSNTSQYKLWYYYLEENETWAGPMRDAFQTQNWLNYVVVDENPAREEFIISTLDTNSRVMVQVYSSGTLHHNETLTSNINAFYRGFDVAFESVSGDGMVVVNNGDLQPLYYTWDGNDWSDGSPIDLEASSGQPYWIRLEPDPYSDEIALMTLYGSGDVIASIWDGNGWTNTQLLTSGSSATTKEVIDVAYEQQSGEAMFVWNEARYDINYRQWDGSNWSDASSFNIPAMGGNSNFIVLTANPYSDEIMFGTSDNGKDLNTREWDGDGWDPVHTEVSSNLETSTERCFDLSYETASGEKGNVLLVYGNFNTDGIYVREWDGDGWDALPSVNPYPEVTDIKVAQLTSNKGGIVEFAGADDGNDLHHWYFIEYNETWVTSGFNLGEVDIELNKVSEPFDVAFIRE